MRNHALLVRLLGGAYKLLVPVPYTVSSSAFQSFKFLVCVTKIPVARLVGCTVRACDSPTVLSTWLGGHNVARLSIFLQVVLQEVQRTVLGEMLLMTFVHGVGEHDGAPARVDQLLFKVEQLALEAWIRVDYRATCFDVTHCLEKRPILFLHEVGNDASCGP